MKENINLILTIIIIVYLYLQHLSKLYYIRIGTDQTYLLELWKYNYRTYQSSTATLKWGIWRQK